MSNDKYAVVYDTFGNSQDPEKAVAHCYLAPGWFPSRGQRLYLAGEGTESQRSISEWSRSTFGPKTPMQVALRMNLEVAELLSAVHKLYPKTAHTPFDLALKANHAQAALLLSLAPDVEMSSESPEAAREECADIGIMLDQVSYLLGGSLAYDKADKMVKLRERTWTTDAYGQTQHATSFRDPGTGILMEDHLWYLLGDSGSAHTDQGFPSPEEAHSWAMEHAGDYGLEASSVISPIFLGRSEGWTDMTSCNILKGAHVRSFFVHNDPEGWKYMNPTTQGDPK